MKMNVDTKFVLAVTLVVLNVVEKSAGLPNGKRAIFQHKPEKNEGTLPPSDAVTAGQMTFNLKNCPLGQLPQRNNTVCCIPVNCGKKHEIHNCITNGEDDKCVKCHDGWEQPKNVSSLNMDEAVCFQRVESHNKCAIASDHILAPDPNSDNCPLFCECDVSRCFWGSFPCSCNEAKKCDSDYELNITTGECDHCPWFTVKNHSGCGRCIVDFTLLWKGMPNETEYQTTVKTEIKITSTINNTGGNSGDSRVDEESSEKINPRFANHNDNSMYIIVAAALVSSLLSVIVCTVYCVKKLSSSSSPFRWIYKSVLGTQLEEDSTANIVDQVDPITDSGLTNTVANQETTLEDQAVNLLPNEGGKLATIEEQKDLKTSEMKNEVRTETHLSQVDSSPDRNVNTLPDMLFAVAEPEMSSATSDHTFNGGIKDEISLKTLAVVNSLKDDRIARQNEAMLGQGRIIESEPLPSSSKYCLEEKNVGVGLNKSSISKGKLDAKATTYKLAAGDSKDINGCAEECTESNKNSSNAPTCRHVIIVKHNKFENSHIMIGTGQCRTCSNGEEYKSDDLRQFSGTVTIDPNISIDVKRDSSHSTNVSSNKLTAKEGSKDVGNEANTEVNLGQELFACGASNGIKQIQEPSACETSDEVRQREEPPACGTSNGVTQRQRPSVCRAELPGRGEAIDKDTTKQGPEEMDIEKKELNEVEYAENLDTSNGERNRKINIGKANMIILPQYPVQPNSPMSPMSPNGTNKLTARVAPMPRSELGLQVDNTTLRHTSGYPGRDNYAGQNLPSDLEPMSSFATAYPMLHQDSALDNGFMMDVANSDDLESVLIERSYEMNGNFRSSGCCTNVSEETNCSSNRTHVGAASVNETNAKSQVRNQDYSTRLPVSAVVGPLCNTRGNAEGSSMPDQRYEARSEYGPDETSVKTVCDSDETDLKKICDSDNTATKTLVENDITSINEEMKGECGKSFELDKKTAVDAGSSFEINDSDDEDDESFEVDEKEVFDD